MIDGNRRAAQFEGAVSRKGSNFNLAETVTVSIAESILEVSGSESYISIFAAFFADSAERRRVVNGVDGYGDCRLCSSVKRAVKTIPTETAAAAEIDIWGKAEIP